MRRYDDPVEVRRGLVNGPGGALEGPEQFLWRGRLWKVCDVVAHWVETGPWWQSPGVHAVLGSDAGSDLADERADDRTDRTERTERTDRTELRLRGLSRRHRSARRARGLAGRGGPGARGGPVPPRSWVRSRLPARCRGVRPRLRLGRRQLAARPLRGLKGAP